MKTFYYDVETTGLYYWKNGIHQLSGIIEIDGEIVDRVNLKIQPHEKAIIEDEALAVSKVTREDLKSYTPFKDSYKILMSILSKYCDKYNKTDKFHLIGYNNASFDNHFFRAYFVQNDDKYFNSWFWIDTIDVMVLASQYFRKERSKIANFKLATVAERLGIEAKEEELHDALYDIELTRNIYLKLTH